MFIRYHLENGTFKPRSAVDYLLKSPVLNYSFQRFLYLRRVLKEMIRKR